MPKLSESTLAKRFACSECGKSFRTRQGLSGHIRFKHKISKPLPGASIADLIQEAKKIKKLMLLAGYSEEESQAFAEILPRWNSMKGKAKLYKIDISNQDFKAYILSSISRWFEFQDFKRELDIIYQKHTNQL
jgi:hypothetical protein